MAWVYRPGVKYFSIGGPEPTIEGQPNLRAALREARAAVERDLGLRPPLPLPKLRRWPWMLWSLLVIAFWSAELGSIDPWMRLLYGFQVLALMLYAAEEFVPGRHEAMLRGLLVIVVALYAYALVDWVVNPPRWPDFGLGVVARVSSTVVGLCVATVLHLPGIVAARRLLLERSR